MKLQQIAEILNAELVGDDSLSISRIATLENAKRDEISFLANKKYIRIVSIVAPYKFLRDELKDEFPFLEVYLHTKEIRGRENFFAKDYEIPTDPKHLAIDTGKLTIKESVNEIFNVYRKMATLA